VGQLISSIILALILGGGVAALLGGLFAARGLFPLPPILPSRSA
jgi:hypothetical protein